MCREGSAEAMASKRIPQEVSVRKEEWARKTGSQTERTSTLIRAWRQARTGHTEICK